jgi:hypothetical protein
VLSAMGAKSHYGQRASQHLSQCGRPDDNILKIVSPIEWLPIFDSRTTQSARDFGLADPWASKLTANEKSSVAHLGGAPER